jgi:hypothetical protein
VTAGGIGGGAGPAGAAALARATTAPAAIVLAASLAAASLAGCTGEPPVISRVFAMPVFVRDIERGVTWARLGVFLVATDPDGQEDLSAFYVINDDAELYWKVESGSWITATAEGESWIGSNSLAMPGADPPPAGEYRVVLQDQGGDTVEDTFAVPPLGQPQESEWPSASLEEDTITVTNPPEVTQAWFYSRDGKLVATMPVPAGTGRLSGVRASVPGFESGATFWIYGYDRATSRGLLIGPYRAP